MDIKLPQMDGIEATRRIKAISPQSRVVMLTIYEASDYQAAASAAGADANVPKRTMHSELVPAMNKLFFPVARRLPGLCRTSSLAPRGRTGGAKGPLAARPCATEREPSEWPRRP
jgi:DNA-binding response OmpR family regulator